jgi:hypothetical protein
MDMTYEELNDLTHAVADAIDDVTGSHPDVDRCDVNDMLTAFLQGKGVTFEEEEEEESVNIVKAQYDNGACPDCGESIPDDVVDGGECKNCGHVFWSSKMSKRTVEYFRMWDNQFWDTDYIEIEDSDDLNQAVIDAAQKIEWDDDAPAMVGFYCDSEEDEEDDE